MWPFCKHKWRVLDKTLSESAFEQMSKIQPVKEMKGGSPAYYRGIFKKKITFLLVCEKCSKLKTEVY